MSTINCKYEFKVHLKNVFKTFISNELPAYCLTVSKQGSFVSGMEWTPFNPNLGGGGGGGG